MSNEKAIPACLESGDWDGLKSDLCLVVDAEGNHHLAHCYYYDGVGETHGTHEWYDQSDFGLRHDVVSWIEVEKLTELESENASLKELVEKLKKELTKRASAFPLKDGVTFAEGYSVCAKETLEYLTNNQQSDE